MLRIVMNGIFCRAGEILVSAECIIHKYRSRQEGNKLQLVVASNQVCEFKSLFMLDSLTYTEY